MKSLTPWVVSQFNSNSAKVENYILLNSKLRIKIKQNTESYNEELNTWVTIKLLHTFKLCSACKKQMNI